MIQATRLFLTEREKLYNSFKPKLQTAYNLNRKTVSFQANKIEPGYRLFKYKEGFSSSLVQYFLSEYATAPGKLLDPFAGAGTSLFAGHKLGWDVSGIELLPVGAFAVRARLALAKIDPVDLENAFHEFFRRDFSTNGFGTHFNHLAITKDAFSHSTEVALNRYLEFCLSITNTDLQTVLSFAAFSVLEDISYTRKDGQYLRWDHRSNRKLSGKPFDKGLIPTFNEAVRAKLDDIVSDASNQGSVLLPLLGEIENIVVEDNFRLVTGSCLEILPACDSEQFDFVITSPPYCNRYDYTRTYALELAYLGLDDVQVRKLRQQMLSCTVENKEKLVQMEELYTNIGSPDTFTKVLATYESSEAMGEVNIVLEKLKDLDRLNNKNIARMVKNYFLEMCFVIYELARITKSNGYCVMVNDNVRYGGEEIPADLILSEFAQSFGYSVDKILVLPRGKGNSSQQMGSFGRTEVRKCVYVWRKM
jgi:hypothetical protein